MRGEAAKIKALNYFLCKWGRSFGALLKARPDKVGDSKHENSLVFLFFFARCTKFAQRS